MDHYEIAAEHDIANGVIVGVRAFHQRIELRLRELQVEAARGEVFADHHRVGTGELSFRRQGHFHHEGQLAQRREHRFGQQSEGIAFTQVQVRVWFAQGFVDESLHRAPGRGFRLGQALGRGIYLVPR